MFYVFRNTIMFVYFAKGHVIPWNNRSTRAQKMEYKYCVRTPFTRLDTDIFPIKQFYELIRLANAPPTRDTSENDNFDSFIFAALFSINWQICCFSISDPSAKDVTWIYLQVCADFMNNVQQTVSTNHRMIGNWP